MFPEHEWTNLSLPGRYFNWRIRGNALTWGLGERKVLEQHYDMVVATSMVDCATLRGLVSNLAVIPWIVYFHENQFAYPVDKENDHTEPKMVTLYNALCAEKIIFNTKYNLDSFIDGLSNFLKKMPDGVPDNVIDLIAKKSHVLAVPVESNMITKDELRQKHAIPVLLWNHRWEYDKGPERLYNLLVELRRRNFSFKLNLIGQRFRLIPEAIKKIKDEFSDIILNFGFIEEKEIYKRTLNDSDFVLSTSLHDFQGVSVLEGVVAGCIPVVPQRLAYPEIFPDRFCYRSELLQENIEATSMADKIVELNQLNKKQLLKEIEISIFSKDNLRPSYLEILFSH